MPGTVLGSEECSQEQKAQNPHPSRGGKESVMGEGIGVSEMTRKAAPKESDILDKVSKVGAAHAASLTHLFQQKG